MIVPRLNMGVSKNSATPKWLVYKGKPYVFMDDLGGPKTPILGLNAHMMAKKEMRQAHFYNRPTDPKFAPWKIPSLAPERRRSFEARAVPKKKDRFSPPMPTYSI